MFVNNYKHGSNEYDILKDMYDKCIERKLYHAVCDNQEVFNWVTDNNKITSYYNMSCNNEKGTHLHFHVLCSLKDQTKDCVSQQIYRKFKKPTGEKRNSALAIFWDINCTNHLIESIHYFCCDSGSAMKKHGGQRHIHSNLNGYYNHSRGTKNVHAIELQHHPNKSCKEVKGMIRKTYKDHLDITIPEHKYGQRGCGPPERTSRLTNYKMKRNLYSVCNCAIPYKIKQNDINSGEEEDIVVIREKERDEQKQHLKDLIELNLDHPDVQELKKEFQEVYDECERFFGK